MEVVAENGDLAASDAGISPHQQKRNQHTASVEVHIPLCDGEVSQQCGHKTRNHTADDISCKKENQKSRNVTHLWKPLYCLIISRYLSEIEQNKPFTPYNYSPKYT